VVDRLTKVAHFIPRNTIDDAPTIVNKFSHEIFILHGFLEMIISDTNSKFTFIFWKSLHKTLGTKLNMSSIYHPEIEQVNRDLENMLKIYCMEKNTKWEDYLYLVQFAYNNGYHSSLVMDPFKALYEGDGGLL